MRKLEWDDMGVKFHGQQLHHLRFADDIVLTTSNTSQTERKFDEIGGNISLGLTLSKKASFEYVRVPFVSTGTNILERSERSAMFVLAGK
ncbi:hypothetical protein RB195_013499 [Necator americanus]|uniref:Reverse transcriptase domain-containing protein n=1 Tax=Necator americanus TaxID=51031 RepID=A0ABR1DWG0_NECAM